MTLTEVRRNQIDTLTRIARLILDRGTHTPTHLNNIILQYQHDLDTVTCTTLIAASPSPLFVATKLRDNTINTELATLILKHRHQHPTILGRHTPRVIQAAATNHQLLQQLANTLTGDDMAGHNTTRLAPDGCETAWAHLADTWHDTLQQLATTLQQLTQPATPTAPANNHDTITNMADDILENLLTSFTKCPDCGKRKAACTCDTSTNQQGTN